jgi:3-oxoacyl-[acyl-carrier-protein] synthase-1
MKAHLICLSFCKFVGCVALQKEIRRSMYFEETFVYNASFFMIMRFVMNERVAVTGIGMVSPLGNNVGVTWANLLSGDSGIQPIRAFDASAFTTTMAAEVKHFSLHPDLFNKRTKYVSGFNAFALEAAYEALLDAAIFPTDKTASRWGVIAGAGMMTADYPYLLQFQQTFAQSGQIDWSNKEAIANFVRLSDFGRTLSNTGLSLLVEQFNIRGYSTAVHTACASGGQALGLSLQVLRRDEVDFVLAGGFDSMIHPMGLASFSLLGAMSTYNDTPETASRPFDATRNGFVLGEGAAFLILEKESHAKKRGAKIYAYLAGEGNSISSYRITDSHPNGDGAIQAIQGALRQANVHSSSIDYINAHGTSTKMNDFSETNAIKAVFKERAYEIPISSTKSQTGHLIAAAGALEAVLTIKSIHHGMVLPTKNLHTPDPECDLNYVPNTPIQQSIGVAMSNSFGFGGSNSAIIFTHPDFEGESHA